MLITDGCAGAHSGVAEIRELGRATQGVTLISLDEGAKLSGLQRIVENDAGADLDNEPSAGTTGEENP
jgi:DNA gyrase subunit A